MRVETDFDTLSSMTCKQKESLIALCKNSSWKLCRVILRRDSWIKVLIVEKEMKFVISLEGAIYPESDN